MNNTLMPTNIAWNLARNPNIILVDYVPCCNQGTTMLKPRQLSAGKSPFRKTQPDGLRVLKVKSANTNSLSCFSPPISSLLWMQYSLNCSLLHLPTVPASLRVRTPTPTTPAPLGPTPDPSLALPPVNAAYSYTSHARGLVERPLRDPTEGPQDGNV